MTPEQSHGLFVEYTTKKNESTGLSLVETMDTKEMIALKQGWEAMREHGMSMLGFQNYLAFMALEASKRTPGKLVFSINLDVQPDLTVNMWDPRMILADTKNKPVLVMKKRWGQDKAKMPVNKGYKESKK